MSLFLLGVNHRTCPVEVRERLAALGADAMAGALREAGWPEAVVLSTCNRFEVYAVRPPAEPARGLGQVLDGAAGVPASRYAYRRRDAEAAGHLFRVAGGLDSLVLGETEILGQVRQAYEAARDRGTTGKRTNVLFQRSLFVGKAVRSRTGISAGQVSVASAAVELARRIFGRLNRSSVLVLGAGDMAEKTVRHLSSAKVARIWIANRTWERAEALAAGLGAEAVPWEAFPARLAEADVVVSSTGAPTAILTRPLVEAVMAGRRGRPLFLIDIAMPRDVSEDVDRIEGVYLYAMHDLQGVVEENVSRRRGEIAAAEAILAEETARFGEWLRSLEDGREISLRHAPVADPLRVS